MRMLDRMELSGGAPSWVPRVQLTRRAALAATLLLPSITLAQAKSVVRFIPEYEFSVFDPVTTVSTPTTQHAYLIYDNLFSLDAAGKPQPQMVERFTTDPSGRITTMVLRAGQKFHDGSPVRAADAVASIDRWAKKDSTGQKLVELGMKTAVVDDRTFTIEMAQPTALLLDGL